MPANQSNNRTIRFIKFWLPVLLCMGFIFYASSVSGTNMPFLFPGQDIAFHFFIYLILAWFFARALKNTYVGITPLKIIFFTVILGTIYGLTDELHQAFVPSRFVSGLDVFIDGIGSFSGGLFYTIRTFFPNGVYR